MDNAVKAVAQRIDPLRLLNGNDVDTTFISTHTQTHARVQRAHTYSISNDYVLFTETT